ncbi:hypothetical protein Droror1_Dr00008675 [Drosera rotundifolia]
MSCCNGNCGCGSNCKCGNGCNGCKMYADLSCTETPTTSATLITGFAPKKSVMFLAGLLEDSRRWLRRPREDASAELTASVIPATANETRSIVIGLVSLAV